MGVQVTINTLVGQSPFDIYICQSDGTSCYYIATITTVPYVFDIPEPYNTQTTYMVKAIDDNGCVISDVGVVV